MRRTRFDGWPCSIARTTDLLGDWWTPLVLREAFLGARRFDDFVDALGISRNTLADRLQRLTDETILTKREYQSKPVRNEYHLTDKGRSLFGVLAAMMRWGDDWLAGEQGPPVELVDRRTGAVIRPVVVDEATGEPLEAGNVSARPGPGMPSEAAVDYPRRRSAGRVPDGRGTAEGDLPGLDHPYAVEPVGRQNA